MPDFSRDMWDRLSFRRGSRPAGRGSPSGARRVANLRAAVGTALDAEATVEEIGRSEAGETRLRLRASPVGGSTEALMLIPGGRGHIQPCCFPRPRLGVRDRQGKGHRALGRPRRGGAGRSLAGAVLRRHVAGDALVARGYAVVAADALGWASRQGEGYDAQQALAANLMQFGVTLAGLIAAEDAQLVRWLARQPAVDARRVGVLGFSFGGYRAWQAAALCPEVAAGVAAELDGAARRPDAAGRQPVCGASPPSTMLHPALGGRLDYPDVAGLAGAEAGADPLGRHDRHFPADLVEKAFGDLRRIGKAAGVVLGPSAPGSPTVPMCSHGSSRRARPRFSSGRWR